MTALRFQTGGDIRHPRREGGRVGSERVGESVQQNDVIPVRQYVAAGPSV